MKHIFIFYLFFTCLCLNAQTKVTDILYLKNGTILKGSIIEMNPTSGIKIRTSEGAILDIRMDDIDKSEREQFIGKEITQETSSDVTDEVLENHFLNFFQENRKALKLIGVSKTNGINREIMGQKIRAIEYELIFEATQDLFISDMMSINGSGFVKDFSYLTKQPQGWDSFLNSGSKKLEKNQRVSASGVVNFEETDNGWRANSFTNKNYKVVETGYLTPSIALQLEERKEKSIAILITQLDWKYTDSDPVLFEYNYYNTQNVPYFSYGNSKYKIQTLDNYNNRNDVASDIQNTFYEAINSTNRDSKSSDDIYDLSKNKSSYNFLIEKVDFIFYETGYQCFIYVKGIIEGEYTNPNSYPFNYSVSLNSNSSKSLKTNMSKAESFNEALKDFKQNVVGMSYKYGAFQMTVKRIEIGKKGNVENIVFVKPEIFVNLKKIDFIIIKSEDLYVEEKSFKMKEVIGNCTFKGKITGEEIFCDVSGAKNKDAIGKFITNINSLIGISSY